MYADYLVYTTTNPDIARTFYALVLGEEGAEEPRYRLLLGAEGVQVGKRFIGAWNDGRWLLSATGEGALEPWGLLAGSEEPEPGEESVARVDLQVTIPVPDADAIITGMRVSPRYRASLTRNLTGRGATLYVGAPSSAKRLRVYNKSAQAGIELAAGDLLRVELQLRNSQADYALAAARGNSKDAFYSWWRGLVTAMAYDLYDVLPHATAAHLQVELSQPEGTYAAWIDRCVVPALGKASLTAEWPQIKERLLQALDAQ